MGKQTSRQVLFLPLTEIRPQIRPELSIDATSSLIYGTNLFQAIGHFEGFGCPGVENRLSNSHKSRETFPYQGQAKKAHGHVKDQGIDCEFEEEFAPTVQEKMGP